MNRFCFVCFLNAESAAKYQVFLGGSCNPTTWRQDIAIPLLKTWGLTYFNPVRSHFFLNLQQHKKKIKKKIF